MEKYLLLVIAALFCCHPLKAQRQRLFTTQEGAPPYRIPALAQNRHGQLIAVSDYRPCGADIGFGSVDLHLRFSADGGQTWGEEQLLTHGTGVGKENVWNFAFGDCAIVADSESDEVLIISVCGQQPYPYSKRDNPNRTARFRSHDGGLSFDDGEEITEQIYGLFDNREAGVVNGLFISSGKICQSKRIHKDRYYRLYAAACTLSGVFVLYSDDFGQNWEVLGGAEESPCIKGDESKCEELPDGSVVLSCRTEGRYFNVFHYDDAYNATGHWDTYEKAPAFDGIRNSCNGEVLELSAVRSSDLHPVRLLLQTVPFGPERSHVGFFYQELGEHNDAHSIANGWQRGMQVSEGISAYSTMIMLQDGRVGLLWEEGPANYHIDYLPLSVEEITQGKYY